MALVADPVSPEAAAIGAQIRWLRREAGLTQDDLAVRCRTWRPIVGRWERGQHFLTLDTLARIAAGLGVELVDIVCVLDDPGADE